MARIHPSDAPQRRPRLPEDLAARIEAARGDVSLTRWVVRACEMRLAGTLEAAPVTNGSEGEDARVSPPPVPASPRAPRKKRASKAERERDFKEFDSDPAGSPPGTASETLEPPPEPPEEPLPGDTESPSPDMPTAVQLAQREGVTLSMARRWLESGEWAMYWP